MHIPPSPTIYDSSAASLSALRLRFSRRLSLRDAKIAYCLSSTPVIQYPKLAPAPPKTGYAHSEPLLKNGRISRPNCHTRTASPVEYQLTSSLKAVCCATGLHGGVGHTEATPKQDFRDHCEGESSRDVCSEMIRVSTTIQLNRICRSGCIASAIDNCFAEWWICEVVATSR
jgi:hypothetical protein